MKIITLAILVLLLAGMTDARMPLKGDHVQIITTTGPSVSVSDGYIEDITDSLLCMSCEYSATVGSSSEPNRTVHDICIGMGSIVQLQWKESPGDLIKKARDASA